MNVILSFSGGKDSVLALHKTIAEGHTCVGLLVMYNTDAGRSWFHGAESALLDERGKPLGPQFHRPAEYLCGAVVRLGHISAVDIWAKEGVRQ